MTTHYRSGGSAHRAAGIGCVRASQAEAKRPNRRGKPVTQASDMRVRPGSAALGQPPSNSETDIRASNDGPVDPVAREAGPLNDLSSRAAPPWSRSAASVAGRLAASDFRSLRDDVALRVRNSCRRHLAQHFARLGLDDLVSLVRALYSTPSWDSGHLTSGHRVQNSSRRRARHTSKEQYDV